MSIGAQMRQMDKEAEEAAAAEFRKEQSLPLVNEAGVPTKEGWRKIGELFRKPMQSKQRQGPKGRVFDYITARQVQDRLDAVVGPGNWSTDFYVIDKDKEVVQCTISIFHVAKTDVGYSNSPDTDTEVEPFKAAYSDAFKRAAVQWGIGRFLYGD